MAIKYSYGREIASDNNIVVLVINNITIIM